MKRKGLILTFLISFVIAFAHCKKGGDDDNNLLMAWFFLNQNSGSTVDITLQGTLTSGGSPLANYTVVSGTGSAVSAFSTNTSLNSTCPATVPAGSVCATTDSNGVYSITVSASVASTATTAGAVSITLGLYDASGTKQADMVVTVTYIDGGSTATASAPVVTASAGGTVTITASTPTVTVTVVVPGSIVLPTCGTTGPAALFNDHPGVLYSYVFTSPANLLAGLGVNGAAGLGCKPTSMVVNSGGTITFTYTYSYDSLGRLSTMNFPTVIGTTTNTYTATYNFAYRPSSLLLDKYTAVCQNSAAGSATAQYVYDSSNRLTAIANLVPDTCSTSGAASSTLTQTNTAFTYSGTSSLAATQSISTSTSNITYTLDGNGRVTQQVSVNGTNTSTANYGYDASGRMTSSTSGTFTTTYTYDGSGRLTGMVQPILPTATTTWTHTYDGSGNLQQILQHTGTTTNTYSFSN